MILLIWLVGGVLMIAGIGLFLADVFALRAARKPFDEMQLGKAI